MEKLRPRIVPDTSEMCTKDMLKNVQAIASTTLPDSFLCHFTNLEYIIYRPNGKKNKELLEHYPTLKQFDFIDACNDDFDWKRFEIVFENFFKRHPNIKTFSSRSGLRITNWLLDSGLSFDDLVVEIFGWDESDADQIIENLYSLHKKQQFKILHLKTFLFNLLLSSKLSTLKFVESIQVNIHNHEDEVVNGLIGLPNLKFLIYGNCLRCNLNQQHCELIAKKLVALEEFHTSACGVLYNLKVFARYSAKLIHIDRFPVIDPETLTTTIQVLDKERRKLKDACKLTIYMEEI